MFVTSVIGLFFNLIQMKILHSGDGHYHLGGGHDHSHGHDEHDHNDHDHKHNDHDHKDHKEHKHEKKVKIDIEKNEIKKALKEGLIEG